MTEIARRVRFSAVRPRCPSSKQTKRRPGK
nr:MAG TPA: hypothetical protein [Caudoviricetes sp.]